MRRSAIRRRQVSRRRREPTDGKGDCYEVAASITLSAISRVFRGKYSLEPGAQPMLVHGTVVPLLIHGVPRHGHAWVEVDGKCIDYGNGHEVKMDRMTYYLLGCVQDVVRYTPEQARRKVLEYEHYGPWEMDAGQVAHGEVVA